MVANFRKHAAFTLIELTIVIIIMAILSVAMAVSCQKVQLKVRYDANVDAITELFQRARSMSLSTLMIDGTDPTYYYELYLDSGSITLTAYSTNSSVYETLDSFDYDAGMDITSLPIGMYYFPPSGEVCIGAASCASGATQASITFEDDTGTHSTSFTITTAGGYVDVVQLLP